MMTLNVWIKRRERSGLMWVWLWRRGEEEEDEEGGGR